MQITQLMGLGVRLHTGMRADHATYVVRPHTGTLADHATRGVRG